VTRQGERTKDCLPNRCSETKAAVISGHVASRPSSADTVSGPSSPDAHYSDTMWCPSHCNIRGNERADTLAKLGASSKTPCQFSLTTKTWLLTQAQAEFLACWKNELPLSNPSFKFPTNLHGVDWANTRAIWRVFGNRSPTDSPPNITADPCPCGLDLNSSHHLLQDCPLLARQ